MAIEKTRVSRVRIDRILPYNLVIVSLLFPTAFNPAGVKPGECDEVEETRRTRDDVIKTKRGAAGLVFFF